MGEFKNNEEPRYRERSESKISVSLWGERRALTPDGAVTMRSSYSWQALGRAARAHSCLSQMLSSFSDTFVWSVWCQYIPVKACSGWSEFICDCTRDSFRLEIHTLIKSIKEKTKTSAGKWTDFDWIVSSDTTFHRRNLLKSLNKRSHLFCFSLWLVQRLSYLPGYTILLCTNPQLACLSPPSALPISTTKHSAPSLPMRSRADSDSLVVGLLSYQNTLMNGRNCLLT